MPRKPSESIVALQQRLAAAESTASALRLQNSELGTHVRLLQQELAQAEVEIFQSRAKPSQRRRTKQGSTSSSVQGEESTPDLRRRGSAAPATANLRRAQSTDASNHGSNDSLAELDGSVTLGAPSRSGAEQPVSNSVTPEPSLAGSHGGRTASPEISQSRVPSGASGSPPLAVEPEPVSGTVVSGKYVAGTLHSYECPPLRAALASTSKEVDLDRAFVSGPRVEHAWTRCPGRAFNVRSGPNYAKTGLKRPSLDALYDVVACDAFACPDGKAADLGRLVRRQVESAAEPP